MRSIGIKWASGFVSMVNLTYNLFRYEQMVKIDEIGINQAIIEYDKFNFYKDQIPLHAVAEALA